MKKVLLVLVLLTLVVAVKPVYSAEVDGVWVCQSNENDTNFAMTRENGGYLIFSLLSPDNNTWAPFFGPFDGTTGQLSLVFTNEANGNIPLSMTGTFTLNSPDNATLTTTSCTNFPGQDNCPTAGTVGFINCSKIF